MTFSRLKPDVPKCWLFAACGVMWSGVGVGMCVMGGGWLALGDPFRGAGLGLAGLVAALAAARWGFGAIAEKNIRRLRRLPSRGCFFAFQAWKSYLLVAFMVALGAGLRQSPVSKQVLAVAYIGVGGALLLSSVGYYRHLRRLFRIAGRNRLSLRSTTIFRYPRCVRRARSPWSRSG